MKGHILIFASIFLFFTSCDRFKDPIGPIQREESTDPDETRESDSYKTPQQKSSLEVL
jgi:hypothetical protein